MLSSFYNSLTHEEKTDWRRQSAHKNTNEANIQSFHNSVLKSTLHKLGNYAVCCRGVMGRELSASPVLFRWPASASGSLKWTPRCFQNDLLKAVDISPGYFREDDLGRVQDQCTWLSYSLAIGRLVENEPTGSFPGNLSHRVTTVPQRCQRKPATHSVSRAWPWKPVQNFQLSVTSVPTLQLAGEGL